jgi:polyribonucleotide nucleotidyltransferase
LKGCTDPSARDLGSASASVQYENETALGGQLFPLEMSGICCCSENQIIPPKSNSLGRPLVGAMVTYYVPKAKHTSLIGKGGAVVTRLSRTHDVRINIPRANDPSSAIAITGSANGVKACVAEIESILGFQLSTVALEKAFCHIPDSKYGAILGKARATLNEIESLSGCGIHVPFKDDPSGVVEIEGSKAGIERAIQDIEGRIKGTVSHLVRITSVFELRPPVPS